MSIEVKQAVAALPRMGRAALKERWRQLFKGTPPQAFTPDLLARGIAYRIQEEAFGGLPLTVKRQLERQGTRAIASRANLRPGNRLVRRWRGRTYIVEVVEGGFTHEGQRFSSLSVIARHITGTRWSGPRFFGLVQ